MTNQLPTYPDNILQGKVCLVTGATSGVGLETARGLACLGAQVFLHGRNLQRLESALADIQRTTGNSNLIPLVADVASQQQVSRLAEEVKSKTSRLDVLINNAGAVNMVHQLSPEGIELTFASNHLAYYLLTLRLMEVLLASAPARVIVVSSFAHGYVGKEAVDDYLFTENYEGWKAYSRTKLCNLYFTYELARKLEGSGVTVNALHPGFVNTGIGLNNTPEQLANTPLHLPGHMSSEEGAQTSLYCAVSPDLEGVTGKYFNECSETASSQASYDRDAAAKLWELSSSLTGEDPDVIEKLLKKS
ncbi:MAG TPA: SDR family oxidoreductase [Anaerolineaceae bacterium]|nr:SDR family oxidoreductase [Anaerolineaceae bacterium]